MMGKEKNILAGIYTIQYRNYEWLVVNVNDLEQHKSFSVCKKKTKINTCNKQKWQRQLYNNFLNMCVLLKQLTIELLKFSTLF